MQLSLEREIVNFNVYLQQIRKVPYVDTALPLDLITSG